MRSSFVSPVISRLQMHAARSSYLRGSDVVPWAFCIGRRLLVDGRRRTKKEVLFAVPEDVAMTKELAARAEEELERMPESQREAYVLVRQEGPSVALAGGGETG